MMTYHYPDLGSASDWMKQILNQSRALTRFGLLQMSGLFSDQATSLYEPDRLTRLANRAGPVSPVNTLKMSVTNEIATRRYLDNRVWLTGVV